MRVLIVDDREENLEYLTVLLGRRGWQLETAHDGAEALTRATAHVPDLVITDLLMPVMDGYTLLRHWRANERLSTAVIVVYTATYTEPDDEQLAFKMGADAFIVKPCEPDDFLARIDAILARRDVAPGSRREVTQPEEQLREYSAVLVRKLEQRSLQLEQTNLSLERDIAQRIATETALRESEERFRQLAETIDDVFWLADAVTRRLLYVSPAYEIVFGRTCESLYVASTSWLDLVHPEDLEEVLRVLPRYRSTEGADHTFRICRADGAVRWIRARSYPVLDGGGGVQRLAGVSRDVTDIRLLEDQLRHAQKMEAIGRLAGGIAHDFNNLLSVILSYTSMVLEELGPGGTLRHDIEEVHRAGERATELTRQLLAFSRQQVLLPRVVLVGDVVCEMETLLRRLLGEDVTLVIENNGSGRVHVDPSQIEQIVMNFAVNARDAMPRGGTFTIAIRDVTQASDSCLPGLSPGDYVLLTATDTGMGMSPATRERVFEPFFTTKDVGKGTGLGLPTVFGIVKQSGGHIDVESSLGAGTRFLVYLPRTDKLVESRPGAASTPPTTLRGTETILLVEDEEQIRVMSRVILRRSGYEVLDAEDGIQAMALSERFARPIHLLVTDLVMPQLGGHELAKRMLAARPDLRVLYVSGYPHDLPATEPGSALLEKPITPEGLLRKVREVLTLTTASHAAG